METKVLTNGLIKLTPSTKGNKIMSLISQRKHSEVVCKEEQVSQFKEVSE